MTTGPRTSERPSLLEDLPASHEKSSSTKVEGSSISVAPRTIFAVIAVLFSVLVLAWVTISAVSSWRNSPEVQSRTMTVVDIDTHEVIPEYVAGRGKSVPFTNSKTGKATLYPAEACYWTKDGKAKFPPTFVVLEERMGKPGPTRCPDCGRVVKLYNPPPPDVLMQAAWDAYQRKK